MKTARPRWPVGPARSARRGSPRAPAAAEFCLFRGGKGTGFVKARGKLAARVRRAKLAQVGRARSMEEAATGASASACVLGRAAPAGSQRHSAAGGRRAVGGGRHGTGAAVSMRPRRALPAGTRRRALRVYLVPRAVANNAVDVAPLDGVDLHEALPEHPLLRRGTLKNGLRYVVLPNPVPPDRFEAHLEMHVGSVDEKENQQGLAHLVEHVTFLGSRKREALLGTGTRSNAYTDFHHTVFHVHAPNTNSLTGRPMLPQVLAALREIAFEPQLLPSRLEKERRAVLAEMKMMNTIDYRVDVQLLTYLHEENALGCRFPIGQEDQIVKWTREELVGFHSNWYYPANATLYVVGDFPESAHGAAGVEDLIEQTFGDIPTKLSDGARVPVPRQVVRPPVEHVYGNVVESAPAYRSGRVEQAESGAGASLSPVEEQLARDKLHSAGVEPSIFRHPLLHEFSINMFCKLPIMKVKTLGDLRRSFVGRVVLSVLKFRLNSHFAGDSEPKFTSFDLDFSDSGREGCTVTTLTITSEPKDWKEAVQLAVAEVRRMQAFGITKSEYKHYCAALLRDSRQLAEQAGTVPSVDNLDFVMESDALGHVVMDQVQSHVALEKIVPTITLDDVNAYARSILSYISLYEEGEEVTHEAGAGQDDSPALSRTSELEEGSALLTDNIDGFAEDMGPTRATSIVACIPAYVAEDGASLQGPGVAGRGGSLGTMDHEQLAAIVEDGEADLEALAPQEDTDAPEGAKEFKVGGVEIRRAIADKSIPLEAVQDFEVPDNLIPDEVLDERVRQAQPCFVPLEGEEEVRERADPVTGITQKRLSNGIVVNYYKTQNEPRAAMARVVAPGGRALEQALEGVRGQGSVALATRALSEVGALGPWERQQVELFCVSNLIHFVLETTEEFVVLDFHFASAEGGIRAVLEMIHLLIQQPRWDEASLVRAKQAYRAHHASQGKSLERATLNKALGQMVGGSCCFLDPAPAEIDAVTLEGAAEVLAAQLCSRNLEVNVVGDFDEQELESNLLRLMGTLPDKQVDWASWPDQPLGFVKGSFRDNNSSFLLADSDERACAYIVGPAPYRWKAVGGGDAGETAEAGQGGDLLEMLKAAQGGASKVGPIREHPLYMSVCLSLMAEIINSRLFTTVRDSLGLTYDVSFELQLLDRLELSWFSVSVTSTPAKIHDALEASLHVLKELRTRKVTQHELDRARRTLLARHETDLKDNSYWIGLLTHLQCAKVPRKSLACLQDLTDVYQAAQVTDIYEAYSMLKLSDEDVYTCTGISGNEDTATREGGLVGGDEEAADMQAEAAAAIARAAQNGNLFEAIRIAIEQQQKG